MNAIQVSKSLIEGDFLKAEYIYETDIDADTPLCEVKKRITYMLSEFHSSDNKETADLLNDGRFICYNKVNVFLEEGTYYFGIECVIPDVHAYDFLEYPKEFSNNIPTKAEIEQPFADKKSEKEETEIDFNNLQFANPYGSSET